MVRGHAATTTTTVTTYCKPTNLKSNEWEENGFLSLGSSQVPTKQLTSESCGGAGLGWPGLGTCLFVCLCWKQLLIMVIVSLGHTDRSGYRGEGRAAAATSIIMASPGLSCPLSWDRTSQYWETLNTQQNLPGGGWLGLQLYCCDRRLCKLNVWLLSLAQPGLWLTSSWENLDNYFPLVTIFVLNNLFKLSIITILLHDCPSPV